MSISAWVRFCEGVRVRVPYYTLGALVLEGPAVGFYLMPALWKAAILLGTVLFGLMLFLLFGVLLRRASKKKQTPALVIPGVIPFCVGPGTRGAGDAIAEHKQQ